MNVYDACVGRRTIRKFTGEEIPHETLLKLIDAARLSPTGSNMQPMKFILVEKKDAARVFPLVRWAGYIAPRGTPAEGEEPTAYIIVLADTEIRASGWELDAGAAAMSILLTAYDFGIGSCWMGAVDREGLRREFNIPAKYTVNTVISLGYPAETSVAEPMGETVKYTKDEKGVYHVPKRSMEEILICE